jgi:hypothetical protein
LHRADAHAQLPGNTSDPDPVGARCDDRRHFICVAILQPPAAELGTISLGLAEGRIGFVCLKKY